MNRFEPFLPGRAALRPLIALAALSVTAGFCVAWGLDGGDRAAGEAARQLADTVRMAAQPLRLALRTGPTGANAAREANARSMLGELDAAASRASVQVTRLTPRPTEPGTVNVELLANYGPLVRFIAESEALGGVVRGLQIRSPEIADPQNRQVATFAIEMGTSPLRAAGMITEASAPAAELAVLHPFQAPSTAADRDVSDRYHLTGITRVGTALMATIGGRDYVSGDQLDGMQVTQIAETKVKLSGPGCSCLIRFRLSAP